MVIKAHQRRERGTRMKMAWICANIMNPHLKKPVTPKKLLGESVSLMGKTNAEIKEHYRLHHGVGEATS